mgnify:CR=1 FL=1
MVHFVLLLLSLRCTRGGILDDALALLGDDDNALSGRTALRRGHAAVAASLMPLAPPTQELCIVLRLFGAVVRRNAVALTEYRAACGRLEACSVVVVYDTTSSTDERHRKMHYAALAALTEHTEVGLAAVKLELVTSMEVEQAFAALAAPSSEEEWAVDKFAGDRESSLCHNFGIICVLTVLRRVRSAATGTHPLVSAAHVWLVEDDTRYSGDVGAFFQRYRSIDAHFVSADVGPPSSDWPSTAEESWR